MCKDSSACDGGARCVCQFKLPCDDNIQHPEKILTRIDGVVYDLSSFAHRHPGGAAAIKLMSNIDGTQVLLFSHLRDPKVWRMIKAFKVKDQDSVMGVIKPNHPEYDLMVKRERESIKSGKSLMSWQFFITLHSMIFGAFFVGLYASYVHGHLALGSVLLGWAQYEVLATVSHMGGHHSVLSTGDMNRFYVRWMSWFINGNDHRTFYYSHAAHHAFTNTLDHDEGLDTGAVIWHPNQLFKNHPEWLLKYQAYLWWPQACFAVVATHLMTLSNLFPFLAKSAWLDLSDRRQCAPSAFGALLFIARNVLFVRMFGWQLFTASGMIGSFWGVFTGGANHWDSEIYTDDEVAEMTPMEHLTRTAKNWPWPTVFLDLLTGYSGYHLTHHAYPTQSLEWNPSETESLKVDCEKLGDHVVYQQTSPLMGVLGPILGAGKVYEKCKDALAAKAKSV